MTPRKAPLALSLLACGLLLGGGALAAETRLQHDEWMRKFGTPGGTLSGAAGQVVEDVVVDQHSGWMRKFETPGGSLSGAVRRAGRDVSVDLTHSSWCPGESKPCRMAPPAESL